MASGRRIVEKHGMVWMEVDHISRDRNINLLQAKVTRLPCLVERIKRIFEQDGFPVCRLYVMRRKKFIKYNAYLCSVNTVHIDSDIHSVNSVQ